MSEIPSDAQAIIDCARTGAEPKKLDAEGRFWALADTNGDVQVIDLENERTGLLDRPRRKTGAFHVTDAASLTAYLTKHAVPETEMWADVTTLRVVGVINAHTSTLAVGDPGDAGYADHSVVLTLRTTPAWKAWAGLDRKMIGQVDFAEHINGRTIDIVTPPAADMLELVQTFQANRSVKFESSRALSTGQNELEYRETIEAKAGRAGKMQIPQSFSLFLAPFEGSQPVTMNAGLRYRINDGTLLLGYFLERPEDVLRDAFTVVLEEIKAGTAAPLFNGTTA